MFFFRYIKNKKNLILLYKILFFIFLIKYNIYNSIPLTIAKNTLPIISISFFLTILFSYEFVMIPQRLNYHKFFSKIFVFYSLIHSFCHFYLIGYNIIFNNFYFMNYLNFLYISGVIVFSLILIIFLFSLKIIRKNFFNIFFYTHYLVYLIGFILMFHSKYYIIFFLMLIFKPIYFFFRIIKITSNNILLLDSNYVYLKLYFKKKNKIQHGDCVYLNSSNISKLEKHPFTVIDTSFVKNNNTHEEEQKLVVRFEKINALNYITLCISNNGDWKSKLISTIYKNLNYDLNNNGLKFSIKSYYTTNLKSLKKYDNIIFFCENIGLTPFLSFLYFISKKINQNKFYNIVLYLQIENTKILNILYYDIEKFLSIKSINVEYNIYIRNEEVFNAYTKKDTIGFQYLKGKINYNNIIKNLEEDKKTCIYHCGSSNTLFKIKYCLYSLKKKKINLLYF